MVIRAFQFAGELDEVLVQLSPAAEIGDQVEEVPLSCMLKLPLGDVSQNYF
jgi:hypothetical protein